MEIRIDLQDNTDIMKAVQTEMKEVADFIKGKTFDDVYRTFPWDTMNIDTEEGLFDFYTEYLEGSIHRDEQGMAYNGGVWTFYYEGESLFDFTTTEE